MKRSKRLLACLCAAVMTVSMLSAFTAAAEEAGETSLVCCVTSDPGSLYPYGVATGGKQFIRNSIYEPLFWPDENNELHPILAKSYESLGDGVYEIELFDYIYDSEGNHMTASDVVFSIDMYIEDGKNAENVKHLDTYEAVDDYTLRVTFTEEIVDDFKKFAANVYMLTEAAWNNSPDEMTTTPVGTGLYVLDEAISSSEYTVVARDDYWQTDEEYLCNKNTAVVDKMTCKIITDNSTIAVALESGDIQFTQNIINADRVNFMNDDGTVKDGYVMEDVKHQGFLRMYFNCGEGNPCNDIYLRQAICTAIDNAACAYSLHGDMATACNFLGRPEILDCSLAAEEAGAYYDYDPDAAADLLAQSSYNGETIRILLVNNENGTNTGTLVQAYLNAIGIDVELLAYDDAGYNTAWYDETGSEWDIAINGLNSAEYYWVNIVTELDKNNYSSGKNVCQLDDDTLQDLFETSANPETNSPETTKELLDYVTENCYVYGLYYYDLYYFGTDDIEEVVVDPSTTLSMYNAFVMAD